MTGHVRSITTDTLSSIAHLGGAQLKQPLAATLCARRKAVNEEKNPTTTKWLKFRVETLLELLTTKIWLTYYVAH